MINGRQNLLFKSCPQEKAWNCRKSGLGSHQAPDGIHRISRFETGLPGFGLPQDKLPFFLSLVRDSGFLEIIPGSASFDGAQAEVQASPVLLDCSGADGREVNINIRVNG